jgi:hypothetical protein
VSALPSRHLLHLGSSGGAGCGGRDVLHRISVRRPTATASKALLHHIT